MLLLAILIFGLWSADSQKPDDVQGCCPSGQYMDVNESRRTCVDNVTKTQSRANLPDCGNNAFLTHVQEEDILFYFPNGFSTMIGCYVQSENETEGSYAVCQTKGELREMETGWIPYFSVVSVFFIFLTIVVYLMVPNLQDTQGICVLHLLFSLGIALALLTSLQLKTDQSPLMCEVLAFGMYIFFMYAFFWISALGFHIWKSLVDVPFLQNPKIRWIWIYHLYTAVGTLTLLLCTIVPHLNQSELRPGFGEGNCWFSTLSQQVIFFYLPMLILIVLNMVFFGWALYIIWNAAESTSSATAFRLKMFLKLFIIMGLPWIFEIISAVLGRLNLGGLWLKIIMAIIDSLTALQGLMIFLILVVFRKKVRRELARKTACGIQLFPAPWKYLEDEEADNANIDHTIVEFHNVPKIEEVEMH